MPKMYTSRGDKGETDLMGGKRVSKDDLRINALGEVDELNAVIGVTIALLKDKGIVDILSRVQNDLFTVGSDLSIAPGKRLSLPKVSVEMVKALEKDIESNAQKSEREFVLPGGSIDVAYLQFARTVARRAERAVVGLSKKQTVNPHVLAYINRLSTLLYVLALRIKKSKGMLEEHPTYEDG